MPPTEFVKYRQSSPTTKAICKQPVRIRLIRVFTQNVQSSLSRNSCLCPCPCWLRWKWGGEWENLCWLLTPPYSYSHEASEPHIRFFNPWLSPRTIEPWTRWIPIKEKVIPCVVQAELNGTHTLNKTSTTILLRTEIVPLVNIFKFQC